MKRLFVLLLIVLLGTTVLGYIRGWYSISTASADGKPTLTITGDTEKVDADLGAAGNTIKALSQAAVDMLKGKTKTVSATESTVTGKVESVDTVTHTVHLDSDGQSIPLTVPSTLPVTEHMVGKTVTVTLEKSGDSFVIRKITEAK